MEWSDLRVALALGQARSVAGAARALAVDATTVLRRLDALEAALGARLFERSRRGWQASDAGLAVLAAAQPMADQADAIERQVLGRDQELVGPLRVTTAFVVMEHLLPQPLAAFARACPGVEVEVVENAFLVDLSRRAAGSPGDGPGKEADVALRLSVNVAEHLVGRPLGMTQCRVYARRGAPGLPQSVQPLATLVAEAPWVTFERDTLTRVYDRWMQQHLAKAQIRVRVDLFNAVAAMLGTGIGIGVLPTFMQARHPDLVPVSETLPELAVPLWILTHPDLRRTARVQAFMGQVGDALAARLAADSARGG